MATRRNSLVSNKFLEADGIKHRGCPVPKASSRDEVDVSSYEFRKRPAKPSAGSIAGP